MTPVLDRRGSASVMFPLVFLVATCGPPRQHSRGMPEVGMVALSDTALFAAVARRIDPYRQIPLHIDPRPLRADPTITKPTLSALADVPKEVIALRTIVLRRMGIIPADAVEDFKCPGIDVPLPGMAPRHRPGCPEAGRYKSVAIGLPRRGGPYWPGAAVAGGMVEVPDVDEREPGLSLGHWSVRVIDKTVQPIGGPYAVIDYVFKRDLSSGEWIFVERKVFYIAD